MRSFFDQPVLVKPVIAFHPPLGLRAVRRDDLDARLGAGFAEMTFRFAYPRRKFGVCRLAGRDKGVLRSHLCTARRTYLFPRPVSILSVITANRKLLSRLIEKNFFERDNNAMDSGTLVLITTRILFSAAAAVFAIVVWSKTRDAVWMLLVLGVVSSYIETVYSVLEMFGITENIFPAIDSVPILTIAVSCLPSAFFIAAFCLFLAKRKRKMIN
ncbi:MAG: hypothetical protein LBJ35_05340 [Spirochaetaceae bacterium]|jgi:hypothetical protein|nr:hypothetical protein [Spirochaetaceae bacterium]